MWKMIVSGAAILIVPTLAIAQQPPPPPATRGVAAALQQIVASVELYAEEMVRQMQSKDAQILELTAKCGDPCKPKSPAAAAPPSQKAPQ